MGPAFIPRTLANAGAPIPRQPASRRVLSPALSRRQLGISGAVLLASWCVACSPSDAEKRQWLFGKWQSSRSTTPLHLYSNGEWEIRQDNGVVLQYGLWEYAGKQLVWTVKQGEEINRDINPVISLKPDAFALRENDQSITSFKRLGLSPN